MKSVAPKPLVVGVAFACLASVTVEAAEITKMRLGLHEDKARLVFDLSAPTTYTVTAQPDGRAVVLQLDARIGLVPQLDYAGTPIQRIEVTPGADGGTQITLFYHGPTKTHYFALDPYLKRGDRLVVDLSDGDPVQPTVEPTSTTSDVKLTPKPEAGATPSTNKTLTRPVQPRSTRVRHAYPLIDFGGTWEQEWAHNPSPSGNQKFEALIEPRWDIRFESGNQLVAILRARLDLVGDLGPDHSHSDNYSAINGPFFNNKHAELSLRELYFETDWGGLDWRLGKQQIVWGQADGIKVLDVVNPQSFREFILDDFDDSRIPLWTVNVEAPLGEDTALQLLWIPDTSYHEFAEADSPYSFTSPRLRLSAPLGISTPEVDYDKPNNPLQDSDAGIRLTTFAGGWDLSFNYLYHYQDTPALYLDLSEASDPQLNAEFKRNHLLGGTFSNAFGEVTLRGELAYSSDTYHTSRQLSQGAIAESAEFAAVLGLDWLQSADTLFSVQWFYSQLLDYQEATVRPETDQYVSALWQSDFANTTWQVRLLGLYSLEDEDSLVQLKVRYWMLSNLELWLGLDVFSGDQQGLFGQFAEQDRWLIGMEFGF